MVAKRKPKFVGWEKVVKNYLVANGYDGLYEPFDGCGCTIDDFAPCNSVWQGCVPAYNHKPQDKRGFNMSPTKPRKKRQPKE